jgi:hypothetical protein
MKADGICRAQSLTPFSPLRDTMYYTMATSEKRVFTVRLEVEQIDALRREQKRTGATPGEIIRRAVRAYLGQKAPRHAPERKVR